jgi:TRAP-type mannitol/chloroaromatic compound transport system permease large subunit
MFATATGIVGAVITLMGLLAFPVMLRAGYDVGLSAGVICAGGCLGILIPPSVMLILYDATASVSVPKLYAGALFPGLMLAGFDMLIRCAINPGLAPKLPPEQRKISFVRIVWSLATSFFPLTLLILSVLGALLSEGHGAAAQVSINDIFAGVMPLLLLIIVAVAMFYIFPKIGLWLPRYLYSRD